MVDRCTQLTRAVVVDLDGTLLRHNSFRTYVRAGMRSRRAPLLLWHALVRKLGLTDHNSYRERCMRIIGFDVNVLDFMRSESRFSTAALRFLETKRNEGYRIILATAALEGYVSALWDGEYVATRHNANRIMRDSRGHAKLSDVRRLLGSSLPEYVLSDSTADFPLMQATVGAGGKALLVNPTLSAAQFYAKNLPGVEIIRD